MCHKTQARKSAFMELVSMTMLGKDFKIIFNTCFLTFARVLFCDLAGTRVGLWWGPRM